MNLPIHKYGKTERRKFGKINEVIEICDLVEIQKDSYKQFLEEGIGAIFEDFSPITDYSDIFELYFLNYELGKTPKYDEKECINRDATYSLPLRAKVRLVKKTDKTEIIDSDIFMGDLPIMTENGSFIINGAERVVVSQLVRSPGVYHDIEVDKKTGKNIYKTTIIPNRGAALEFEQDSQGCLWVRVDRKRKKIWATVLLRAIGFGSNASIRDIYGENQRMINTTIEKDTITQTEQDALIELYKRLRPGEVPTEEAMRQYLHNLFFDARRYDVTRVGRYKFNKKLMLANRIVGCKLAETVFDRETGEILSFEKDGKKIELVDGCILTNEGATIIANAGINTVAVYVNDEVQGMIKHRIIGNNTMEFAKFSAKNPKSFGLLETIHYPNFILSREIAQACDNANIETVAEHYRREINQIYMIEELDSVEKTGLEEKNDEVKNREIRKENRLKFVKACKLFHVILNRESVSVAPDEKKEIRPLVEQLNHRHITVDDMIATISANIDLNYGIGGKDNIDHLGNRRVRSIGELLQNQLRVGMARLERLIKERMATQEPNEVTPQALINIRPISAVIREFFGSSQLSQFMDQTNPIAELTHKRKLSALGPGGLNRDRATFEVRDVHHSHYGRMCPIETPEGQNIGLISSLATFAKVNEFGFIMSPYRRVKKEMIDGKLTVIVTDEVDYLSADEEDKYVVAQANEPLDERGAFIHERISCRRQDEITQLPPEQIEYMDVSPKQLVSVATALIPFLENDDTNRALMGSNMQRQAVPLLKTESPIVATGIEGAIARDSGVIVKAKAAGQAIKVSADNIQIRRDDGTVDSYNLKKFERSNQGTCLNQKPIINTGDRVEKDEIIADGPSTNNGELALGKNILIGFMEWEGYNYEDAILISEKLVREDVFTSIHIEEHEIESRDTKLGSEQITRDIPNVGEDALKYLDENGIISIGTEVSSGDILVGKVTPKGETELTPEERLLRAIFGEKAREVRDTSLRVPHGEGGIVVDVKIFTRENKDELPPGVNQLVRVYIAQKRKISVGDKMAGRHGNKGVISRILPENDMPFMADGTPLQIVLNPLGVPSRMNIGQVLEVHLGHVCKQLGWKIATPVFDGATEKDIRDLFAENNIVNPQGEVDGKIQLYDGRTGEPFENRTTVGQMYMIKLIHLVDDKIHARSIGPYSLVTQQPLGGKAQFGGQRFGEMEVWALEAYGAAHILQEILTVKSDDINGRVRTYESIVKGNNISEPGVPEAFKVLLKELQSLALDIKVLTENKEELQIADMSTAELAEEEKIVPIEEPTEEIDFSLDEDIDIYEDEEDFDSSELFDNDELLGVQEDDLENFDAFDDEE